MPSPTASSYITSTMGTFIILIFLTALADKFSAVGADGIDVHIIYEHQSSFEVRDDRESDWNREKRSLNDQGHQSRKLTWSADALAGNNMDEDLEKDKEEGKKDAEKDYEVVDLTGRPPPGLLNEPWVKKLRTMALIPALGLAGLLVILFYYNVILRKKSCTCLCALCPCCNPKRIGRKGVQKYVPGVIINEEDNTTEFYEVTDKEREAMMEVASAYA